MDATTERGVRRMLVSFIDIAGFARGAERTADLELAALLDRYYDRVGEAAVAGGGRLVKLIGDGALLVFPLDGGGTADLAVDALLALRTDVAAMFAAWHATLVVKVHAGDVVCGLFGPRGDRRFDVVGGEVNVAARLATRDFALSAEAFRALSKPARARFKKHTPPVTYLPTEDRRPSAMTKL
jgi:adenylate cyclase